VAIAICHASMCIMAASSNHIQPRLAPRNLSGLSALRNNIVLLPCNTIVPVLMLCVLSMPAGRAISNNILRGPSRSIGYVGATIMPVLFGGIRNTSITPALVLPLPRPPMKARNRAGLFQNISCGFVHSLWRNVLYCICGVGDCWYTWRANLYYIIMCDGLLYLLTLPVFSWHVSIRHGH